MNITIEGLTALIAACGLPILIPKILDFYRAMKSGKATEEKQNNRTALGRLLAETDRADNEASYARSLERFAAKLERMLIQLGVPEDQMPEWPQHPNFQETR